MGNLDRVWGRTEMAGNSYTSFTQVSHTPSGTPFWVRQRNATQCRQQKGTPWGAKVQGVGQANLTEPETLSWDWRGGPATPRGRDMGTVTQDPQVSCSSSVKQE